MICHEAKVSLIAFFISLIVQLFAASEIGEKFGLLISESVFSSIYCLFILYFVLLVILLSISFKCKDFQIAIRAGLCGYIFGIAIFVVFTTNDYKAFGFYFAFLSIFHFSEYFFIALSHPQSVTLDSFMLNHSIQYELAAICSWVEFFTEAYYYPDMKRIKTLWIIGSSICLSGEILRKVAMLTARKSFHHLVQFQQAEDHKLITHGVYKYFRHPAYVGWFYWSVGTQVILANPICFVLYAIASWLFFRERIYTEEITLLNFFGQEYINYQQTTKTGLPCIEGYRTT